MKRFLHSIFAALALATFSPWVHALAPLCPVPAPFDSSTATAISPRNPTDQDEVLFWVFGHFQGFELEGATVDRVGQTIYITTRTADIQNGFPLLPARCRTVSLGTLPPGMYTLVVTSYVRYIDVQPSTYPAQPTTGPTQLPPFTVSATVGVPSAGLLTLVALATLLAASASLRLRRSVG